MRRLLRRIAAVEGALSARHQLDPKIAGSALFSLSLDEMDLLLQASVAVLEGRALTEPQRAARQAYRLALERKCMGAGRRSTTGIADLPEFGRILTAATVLRLSNEDLNLVVSGMEAQEEGRPVSASEAAALQPCQREQERLCEMAGLR